MSVAEWIPMFRRLLSGIRRKNVDVAGGVVARAFLDPTAP